MALEIPSVYWSFALPSSKFDMPDGFARLLDHSQPIVLSLRATTTGSGERIASDKPSEGIGPGEVDWPGFARNLRRV